MIFSSNNQYLYYQPKHKNQLQLLMYSILVRL